MSGAGVLAMQHLAPTVVAVAPTATVLATFDIRGADFLAVQCTNQNTTQTFSGYVQRRTSGETSWATSTLADFLFVLPSTSIMADLDCRGGGFMRLVGTMDGAGGNVQISAHRRASR